MKEKRTILVLRGLQGSGKSTFAKQWASEDPKHRVRFNRDDIRNMFGQYWVPSREPLINDLYEGFLNGAMKKGYDIVIDNMNLDNKRLEEIEDDIMWFNSMTSTDETVKHRYEMEVKDFFDVPLQVCIERDSKRENPIGAHVIRGTYNKYKDIITRNEKG